MNSTLKDQLFFTTHKFGNWWWWWEKFTFVRLKPLTGTSLVPQLAKNPLAMETPVQFLGWEVSPGEGISYPLQCFWASLVAQTVKNLPAKWETWVWSLGWKDPLEKEMATHSNILAWRIPMDWEACWAIVWHELDMTEWLSTVLLNTSLHPLKHKRRGHHTSKGQR